MTEPTHPGGESPLPPGWVAPPDARDLDVDLLAWRRENAAAARRRRLHRMLGPTGRAGPRVVVAAALAVVALFAVGLVLLGPFSVRQTPGTTPLAAPTVPPGWPGGLLPAVALRIGDDRRQVRTLRPAVLAVVPSPCACTPALDRLASQSRQYAVPLVIVAPPGDGEVAALLRTAIRARAFSAYDEGGRLGLAYTPRGLTALLVRNDGVVTAVERNLAGMFELGTELIGLTS